MPSVSTPASFDFDPSLPADVNLAEALGVTFSNDVLDELVRDFIRTMKSGSYTEEETRNAITALVYKQGVHVRGVDSFGVPSSVRDEIIDLVALDITKMLLTTDGSGFDLDTALEKSTCAFVRLRAKNTAQSKARDFRRAENRDGTPSDPTAIAFTSAATYEDDFLTSLADLDRAYEAHEEFGTIAQNTRGLSRLRFCAEYAYRTYNLSLAVRPGDIVERERVWSLIEADDTLAYRSMRAAHAAVHEGDERAASLIDPGVLALWDDMSREMFEELIESDAAARYAHSIAVDAVGPWARPSQRNISKYRNQLASLRKGDLQWRTLTIALAAAFVDHEFQAISDFVSISEEKRESMRKGHVISRSRYRDLLGRAARYDGYPLGSSPAAVVRSLFHLGAEHLQSAELTRFAAQCA